MAAHLRLLNRGFEAFYFLLPNFSVRPWGRPRRRRARDRRRRCRAPAVSSIGPEPRRPDRVDRRVCSAVGDRSTGSMAAGRGGGSGTNAGAPTRRPAKSRARSRATIGSRRAEMRATSSASRAAMRSSGPGRRRRRPVRKRTMTDGGVRLPTARDWCAGSGKTRQFLFCTLASKPAALGSISPPPRMSFISIDGGTQLWKTRRLTARSNRADLERAGPQVRLPRHGRK